MENNLLQFLYQTICNLNLSDVDVYIDKPAFFGKDETRKKNYVIIEIPNGITDKGAFHEANGIITIGCSDKVLGLPNMPEIDRISQAIKNIFPILTTNYSVLDMEFSSNKFDGIYAHEFYYTFHIIINY